LKPHHLLFFTQSETLTLIFLLSHHLHAVAATPDAGYHRTSIDLPPPHQPPSSCTTSLAREPTTTPPHQPPSSRMNRHTRRRNRNPNLCITPESPWLHHPRTHVKTHHYCTKTAREAPLRRLRATLVFVQHAAGTTTHGLHLGHRGSVHGNTMLEREVMNSKSQTRSW